MNKLQNFSKGLIKENPVLVLVLGTCPTLVGAAATVVLLCSNVVISALRKIIPDKVRIPCYIVLIAGFVTMVQMLVKAFAPALDQSLGIYLPLIVVNCIILGRAEMFANKNTVIDSAIDALGMGAGFTLALSLMALIREVFGNGTFFGRDPHHGAGRLLCVWSADRHCQQVRQAQAQKEGIRLCRLSAGGCMRQSGSRRLR